MDIYIHIYIYSVWDYERCTTVHIIKSCAKTLAAGQGPRTPMVDGKEFL